MPKTSRLIWKPRYRLTSSIARSLMEIEGARAVVDQLELPHEAQAELRRRARLRSTHYSTQIEGNRLTLAETQAAIEERQATFHGRDRDVREVRNYWNALLQVEEWAAAKFDLTEERIQRLHALVEKGLRSKPTPYRDGQNSIRDVATGALVYLPPEAADVPALMSGLVEWVQVATRDNLPPPIVAGLAHYQFVTIHPFYDGNGRTARLLATFILQRAGYGLHGYFSLEEYHARDLAAYYNVLQTHPHHNYYEGRANADCTHWLTYFSQMLASVFVQAQEEASRYSSTPKKLKSAMPTVRDPRARIILELFTRSKTITTRETAQALGLSERMARVLLNQWVQEGLLIVAEPSNRKRAYSLSAIYRQFIGNLSAT